MLPWPDVQEEKWDNELELEAKRDDSDAEFEEDRTVTARSQRAVLS